MYLLSKHIAILQRPVLVWAAFGALLGTATAATSKPVVHKRHAVTHRRRVTHAAARVNAAPVTRDVTRAAILHTTDRANLHAAIARKRTRGRHVFYNPWTEPTYADSTVGDKVDGEDLAVRKAAVDALGPYNGTVVVADPHTGRILSIVNQKLALGGAYQPCSTVKVMVSLASLKEGVVDPSSNVRISRRSSMDMTRALAMSNNLYFAKLGQELGFERVVRYGKLFGMGEKAGLDIPGEQPGYLASDVPQSGVGMMTSFGDGIRLTPLELTSIISTVANNGTMYYLQYPQSQDDVQKSVPRIKRQLDLGDLADSIKPGMMGAVEYGTARRAGYSNLDETILGKTGTCTDTAQPGVHLGWFGSFNEFGDKKLVVVVLLTGGRGVSGPIASGIAGNVYHNLALANYFKPAAPALETTSLLTQPAAQQASTATQQ
ncbi:MAG TPA: penicillin-binding transpeptidase domain-containing protein [Bryobacteraceae bacterium]|jgi:beta-lactamase class D|nr:penicillin-binding transpeptidase domain-containing protein [Bryobacteraceae bacterium]